METEKDKSKGINAPFAFISQLQQTHSELLCSHQFVDLFSGSSWTLTLQLIQMCENTILNPSGAAGSLVYVGLKVCVCLQMWKTEELKTAEPNKKGLFGITRPQPGL